MKTLQAPFEGDCCDIRMQEAEPMKRWMKAVVVFGLVFAFILIGGSIGLIYYAEYQNKMAEAERQEAAMQAEAAARAEEEAVQTVAENGDDDPAAPENEEAESKSPVDDEEKIGEEYALPEIVTDRDEAGGAQKDEEEGKEPSSEEAAQTLPSGPVVLTFTGDICFHDAFANMGAFRQRGSSIDRCIDERLLTRMREADICVVNNEFPYSDRGAPLADKAFAFRSKPSNVSILNDMGADVAGIANNHAFDYGPEAFLDTLDTIKEAGVACIGGGRNLTEAAAPAVFEKNGMKIGILAATQIERNPSPDTRGATADTPGVMRCFSESELADFLTAIEKTKTECDIVIVFVHWGTENTDELDFRQTDQAAAFAQAGADLVVGAHPHCLQGLGKCGKVPVIYSLGNYWFNSKTVDTALCEVVLEDRAVKSVQLIPALQHDCRTDQVDGDVKQRIINYINSVSKDGAALDTEGYFIMEPQ